MSDAGQKENRESDSRSLSLPVFMLTALGTLIAVLGLFAAGEILLVVVGLAALTVAGILYVLGDRR